MDPLVARGGTEEVELPTIPMGRAPSPLHAPPPLHAPSGLAQLDTTERLPGAYGVAPGVPQGSGLAGLTRTLEIIVEPGGPQGAPPQVGGAAQMNAMSEVRPHPASPGHRGGLLGGRVSWKAVIAIGAAIGTLFIVVGIMVLLRALSGRAPAGPEASVSASSAPSGGGASAPPASAGPASSVASSPPGPAPATLTSVSGSAGEATRTATAAPPPPPPPPPLPVPVPAPPPKQVPSTPPGTGGVKAPPAVKPVEAKPAAPKGRIF